MFDRDVYIFLLRAATVLLLAISLPFLLKTVGQWIQGIGKKEEMWCVARWIGNGMRSVRRFIQACDSPDRALAFFALFLSLMLLVQQTAQYQRGIVYQLSNSGARENMAQYVVVSPYEPWELHVTVLYWLCAAGVVFAVVSLFRGTSHKADENTRLLRRIEKYLRPEGTKAPDLKDEGDNNDDGWYDDDL